MQQAHQMGQVLFSYATDNGSAYPEGKSSTEICQMLLDGGYVTDPAFFYVPMPGKVKPEPGQKKLKPENVCWDITGSVTGDAPDTLPLVFLTGYRSDLCTGSGSRADLKAFPRLLWARMVGLAAAGQLLVRGSRYTSREIMRCGLTGRTMAQFQISCLRLSMHTGRRTGS